MAQDAFGGGRRRVSLAALVSPAAGSGRLSRAPSTPIETTRNSEAGGETPPAQTKSSGGRPSLPLYAILGALERERVAYILIGGLARVIEGSDELTRGLDLTPSTRPENLRRLAEVCPVVCVLKEAVLWGLGIEEARIAVGAIRGIRGLKAAKDGDEFINLASPARTKHILYGDATGGGHLWPGLAGKTPFPKGWSGDRIMHELSDIATDPASRVVAQQGGRTVVEGTRGGVVIRVVTDGRDIITGFPVR